MRPTEIAPGICVGVNATLPPPQQQQSPPATTSISLQEEMDHLVAMKLQNQQNNHQLYDYSNTQASETLARQLQAEENIRVANASNNNNNNRGGRGGGQQQQRRNTNNRRRGDGQNSAENSNCVIC
mmetsp:Transcript_2732/g.3886  ORF Transcript_2732/g.3886 Transcript_2732/m.3886 type:complete len:126 (+) Transcript_2732:202-579(+)